MKNTGVLYSLSHSKSPCLHYLFGTMHLANRDAYTHVDLALKYLEKCSNYYGEMDLGSIRPEDMESAFRLPDGKRLDEFMSGKQYVRLQAILAKAFNFDIQHFNHYIPFYIQSILAESILEKDMEWPLDYYLLHNALALGKKTGGIETQKEQLAVLDQIPLKNQITSLRKSARQVDKFRKTMIRLSKAYKKGDINTIYKKSRKQLGSLRNLLLMDRNHNMAEVILNNMQVEPCFFSLGAGHLAGGKGVLRLLSSQGCKITPIH